MSLFVDIKKSYGRFNLNIKFEAENEVMGLLGASGCGKSITLRCIAGIEKPDAGRIVLNGVTLFDSEKKINLPPQKRNVGLLFQNYALFPNMTVRDNIMTGIRNKKSNKNIDDLIKSFCLEGLEKEYPSNLSGGQQQRVALARMMASEPKIIMLDEPYSALDSYLRWQLEQKIITILENFDGTTLFVSHDRDEVFRICDRITIMANGEIDITDEKHELFCNPRTYSAAKLIGCKNISKVLRVSDRLIEIPEWGIDLTVDSPIPKDINYVGVKAKLIELCEKYDEIGERCFKYTISETYEDIFTYILMIKISDKNNVVPLRWEISKETYNSLPNKPPYIRINSSNILLLK